MDKSPDAFRTISEVAEWLDTPAHVLRFWESRFTQVKPVKRAGGRRYYRPNDMLLLGGIKKLLHEDGMTIKGAQKMLRTDGIKKVSTLSQPLESSDNDKAKVAAPVKAQSAPPPATEPETAPPTEKPSEPDAIPAAKAAADDTSGPLFDQASDSPDPTPVRPEIIATPPDPADDSDAAATQPGYIARLRHAAPPADTKKQQALTAIYSRLSTLHDRMKASISPQHPG